MKLSHHLFKQQIAVICFYALCIPFACRKPTLNPYINLGNVVDVKKFGAQGNGKTDDTEAIGRAMEQAAMLKQPLYFPRGKYPVHLILKFDSLEIIGEEQPIDNWDQGTIILGLINCNNKKNIHLENLGIDTRNRLGNNEQAGLNSGDIADSLPLNQSFTNISIIGDGTRANKHGILCEAGSNISLKNIRVSEFFHGVAIRSSNVHAYNIIATHCGFTSVVVKSAIGKNNTVRNVFISNVLIYGDPSDPYLRGGMVLIQSFNPESRTSDVTINYINSIWGGESIVKVQQVAGEIQNIVINKCNGLYSGDTHERAAYEIDGGKNIRIENCSTADAFGVGFRSINNPQNLIVKNCFERGSKAGGWSGIFQYLQLNGIEIYK
jgi:Pectate lyase superfamily protein